MQPPTTPRLGRRDCRRHAAKLHYLSFSDKQPVEKQLYLRDIEMDPPTRNVSDVEPRD